MIHSLKILPDFFEAVANGEKLFEIRKYDRPFRVKDLLALNEYDNESNKYTGRCCLVYIDYILRGKEYNKKGYITMSIKPCCIMLSEDEDCDSMNHFGTDYRVPIYDNRLYHSCI